MLRFFKYIYLVVFLVSLVSCEKDDINIFCIKRKIVKNTWKINSCIDYYNNSDYRLSNSTYKFKENGEFLIFPENTNEVKQTTWELIDNNKYLRLGNNIFKIKIITNKIIGLRYGSVEIFYTSVE